MQRVVLVEVSTKARFRRIVPKSYSYRYEIGSTAGPPDRPLVESGCAIIETRYRGRSASWNVSTSMMSEETYTVRGSYVAPSPENPMTYPPRPKLKAPAPAAPVSPRALVTPAPLPPPVQSEDDASNADVVVAPALRPERSTPRADPAGPPSEAEVRAYTSSRRFSRPFEPRPR